MKPKRPTPPPLTKTERQALEDLIRRGARALNPAEGNRLLRLLELDQADRQQERRTAGGLMAKVQQLGGQLKDMTARAEMWEQAREQECLMTATVFSEYYRRWQSTIVEARRQCARAEKAEAQLAAVRALHPDGYGICMTCTGPQFTLWPCPTITALDGATE